MSYVDGGDDELVELDGEVDHWRLSCPAGHHGVNVQQREEHWHCRICARSDVDPAYSYVRDAKTNSFLALNEIDLRRDR